MNSRVLVASVASVVLLGLLPGCDAPECSEDEDCSGRDVCQDGSCEEGPPATQDEAVNGFCEQARRCEPDSTPADCEEQTRAFLEEIEQAQDPDCAAYAEAIANLYACIEDADCGAATECVGDATEAQQAADACDLGGEGEGEGEGG